MNPKYYVFGCPSINTLNAWFKRYMDDLLKIGYEIVTYKVPEAYTFTGTSGRQIAFDKRYAKDRKVIK